MRLYFYAAGLCMFILLYSSCLRKDFDAPPDNSGYDPQLAVTHTIAQIQQMPGALPIEQEVIIQGLVVMNDKSNNLHNKLVIQDESGGLEILLDRNALYNDYPVGRKIYVRCKGLFPGEENQVVQLGYIPDASGMISAIPSILIDQFLVKANFPNAIIPHEVLLSDLDSPGLVPQLINTLVAIKDAEFIAGDAGAPYAEPSAFAYSTDRFIEGCNGGLMALNTSGYADFQTRLTPVGRGTLLAVYSRNGNTPRLVIRDTGDVQFHNPRCSGSPAFLLLAQDFSAQSNNTEINTGGWLNYAEMGDKKFIKGFYQSDHYASISAYGGTPPPVVISWLVSPEIDLSGRTNVQLSFKTKDGYDNGATFKAMISANYSGSDPATATWVTLPANISYGNPGTYPLQWVEAMVPLNNFDGKVHIAFKYEGGGTMTTTYHLANIRVTAD